MQLFVSLPVGKTITLSVNGPHTPVLAVQRQLEKRIGVPLDEQRLCFGGKEIRATRQHSGRTKGPRQGDGFLSLADCAIHQGSTVDLLFRLKGAALLGKDMKGRGKRNDAEERLNRAREQNEQEQRYIAARKALKDKLEREEANSRVNRLKLQNQWRKIMRLAKVENLRKEIEILSQNHERDVDRKDAIVQMLDRDLEEGEDQFQMALRRHLENMDQLIDLQDSRLFSLEQEFEKQLGTIEAEFMAEKESIITHHSQEVQELRAVMHAVADDEDEMENESKQEHEQHREEIKNKNLEEINMLRIQLDSQIEELEQKFENAHLNYLQSTDQRTSDFKYFTKKDQELSKEIEIKIRKIERLQSSLNHWRTKYAQNVKECQARNTLMLEEKNKVQSHFHQLKQRMNKFRAGQNHRLSDLTQNTTKAKVELKDKIELGERILSLAELARKLETDREKVTPYYESTPLNEDEMAPEATRAMEASAEMMSTEKSSKDRILETAEPLPYQALACDNRGQSVRKWHQLDNFWKRYNKALLDKLAVERERARLAQENANFQELLKQYMNGVSVNDEVLSQPGNPLLVVNGRVQLNRPLPVRVERDVVPVVDGNHMVGTQRVNSNAW